MNNQLTYREKFTCEMIWGGVPTDNDYVRNSALFQEGLKRYDSGEWKYYEKEEWRDIKGYEGYYQVSNHGRVKSVERFVYGKLKRIHKERILKPIYRSNGYMSIELCKDKKRKISLVHRLVAQAFIPNPENKREVNHKNGITLDAHVKNLEWVSGRENVVHSSLKLKQNKSSKYVGVSRTQKGLPWRASIYYNGKAISLGNYKTEEDAHKAYLEKMKEIGIENKYL